MNVSNNKGWIIGLISTIVTTLIIFIGGWVQVNNRIAVLETKVNYQQQGYNDSSTKLDRIAISVNDIKENLVEMRGEMKLKADKKLVN